MSQPQAQAQAQVKPREFKFVGAFSRKRRRRNGTGPTGPKSTTAVASTPRSAPTPAAPNSSPKVADGKEENKAKSQQGSPPIVTHAPDVQVPPPDTPMICEETANPVDSEMMLQPVTESMNQGNDIDWSYSSLMNPFFDPGPSFAAPFDHMNGHQQLPLYFGPDIPFVQLDESSSADNSPQDNFIGPNLPNESSGANVECDADGQPSTIDEIVLPSLSSQEAPCNISLTITQLLTRCEYSAFATSLIALLTEDR